MTSTSTSIPSKPIPGPGFITVLLGSLAQVGLIFWAWNFGAEVVPALEALPGVPQDPWVAARVGAIVIAWLCWILTLGAKIPGSTISLTWVATTITGLMITNGVNCALTTAVACVSIGFAVVGTSIPHNPVDLLYVASPIVTALILPHASILTSLTVISVGAAVARQPTLPPNPAVVDRIWSLVPPFMAALFVTSVPSVTHPSARCAAILALTCLWGARLTGNFWLKGGYSLGDEDYRWSIVRLWYTPSQFVFFHAVFVSLYQILLLTALIAPAAVAFHSTTPFGWMDVVVVAGCLKWLTCETLADAAMFAFQQRKQLAKSSLQAFRFKVSMSNDSSSDNDTLANADDIIDAGKESGGDGPAVATVAVATTQGVSAVSVLRTPPSTGRGKGKQRSRTPTSTSKVSQKLAKLPSGLASTAPGDEDDKLTVDEHVATYGQFTDRQAGEIMDGFCQSGLWKYSRHPNYMGEVLFWWCIYLFAVTAGGSARTLVVTAIGPLLLTLLFVAPDASLALTEKISLAKYPAYKTYIEDVDAFIPLPSLLSSLWDLISG